MASARPGMPHRPGRVRECASLKERGAAFKPLLATNLLHKGNRFFDRSDSVGHSCAYPASFPKLDPATHPNKMHAAHANF
ncbi:hypothetical protein GCM10022398_08670 [Acetobacter lovaniensis]|nr:hypothetical protein AA0474_1633 [Acetobacter lovaniensis NRIC 0474]